MAGTPLKVADRVLVQTTTTGTGTYSLGAALSGYLTPAQSGLASGSRVSYLVVDSLTAPTQFEEGEGLYTAGSPSTITRAQIIRNHTGATTAVSWPAGTRYLLLTPSALRLPLLDTGGQLPISNIPVTAPLSGDIYEGSSILSASYLVYGSLPIPVGTYTADFLVSVVAATTSASTTFMDAIVQILAADGTTEIARIFMASALLNVNSNSGATMTGFGFVTFPGGSATGWTARFLARVNPNVSTVTLSQYKYQMRSTLIT